MKTRSYTHQTGRQTGVINRPLISAAKYNRGGCLINVTFQLKSADEIDNKDLLSPWTHI